MENAEIKSDGLTEYAILKTFYSIELEFPKQYIQELQTDIEENIEDHLISVKALREVTNIYVITVQSERSLAELQRLLVEFCMMKGIPTSGDFPIYDFIL